MSSKKELLKRFRLYTIINKESIKNRPVMKIASAIKNAGTGCIVQYRDKTSEKRIILDICRKLEKFFSKTNFIFIVNDHIDIAAVSGSAGVHLGQNDFSVSDARKILGREKIIGVSCHSIKQARKAQKEGADYIAIGPIFPTPTKPGCKPVGTTILKQIRKTIDIPFYAIGGINLSNLGGLTASGTRRICAVSAVCNSKNIKKTISEFNKILYHN